MPLPDFAAQAKAVRLVAAMREIVAVSRVPAKRLGDEAGYRDELAAQAVVEFLAATIDALGDSMRQAVARAEKKLAKQYRELA